MARIALFPNSEHLLAAADQLKARGIDQLTLITPIPVHGEEEVLGKKRSPIKYFSFFGAVIGAICGFSLAAGTSIAYIIPVGGRPVITIPPFLLITYEVTILVGVIGTVIGFFVSSRFPALRDRAYAPEAAVDKFTLLIDGTYSPEEANDIESILSKAGAEAVRDVEDEQ